MREPLLAITLGLVATSAFAAGEHNRPHSTTPDAVFDRTIQVEAGDMWFDPETLGITAGETVRFQVVNIGNLQHEFVIGDAEAQEAHREMMQAMGDSGHGDGHDGHGGHDMAEGAHDGEMPAVTIAPGETAELVWTAPMDVESLVYACNIPGHYESGMYGEIQLGK
ncbi:cupredoxin domain-containing protein [Halomonas cupida]|uniref:cupredoxin domain-containing protein n=1 Tax=Halomonas cupida TaxID=44933 RepID=UPI003EF4B67B|tara:strand:- start:1563 stop:2060 length:498 start_codon:yes stop_codon:yes gene_type:complete